MEEDGGGGFFSDLVKTLLQSPEVAVIANIFQSVSNNGVEDNLRRIAGRCGAGSTGSRRHVRGRSESGAAGCVVPAVVAAVDGGGWRLVVHARGLRAVGVEARRYADPEVQHLHVLPHVPPLPASFPRSLPLSLSLYWDNLCCTESGRAEEEREEEDEKRRDEEMRYGV